MESVGNLETIYWVLGVSKLRNQVLSLWVIVLGRSILERKVEVVDWELCKFSKSKIATFFRF